MDEIKELDTESILYKMKVIRAALDTSEPKMKHYTEPIRRHKQATRFATEIIDKLEHYKKLLEGSGT